MRFSLPPGLFALALAVWLPLSGCDELDRDTDGSAEVLVQNARAARLAGDHAAAVRILDAAVAAYPADASVHTEFAVTLLEQDGLNLFDLERLADFVEGGLAPATGASPLPAGTFCPFALDPTSVRVDPTAFAGYADLRAAAPTLDAVLAHLDVVIPPVLESQPLCSASAATTDGATFNRASARAEMAAQGLTDAEIGAALAANTLARALQAYLELSGGMDQPTAWYRYGASQTLVVCAPDAARLQDDAEGAVAHFGEGVHSFDLRLSVVGETDAGRDVATALRDSYTDLRDAFGAFCRL